MDRLADHALRAAATHAVTELLEQLDGALAALVCTADGFELAQAQRRPVDVARLAAVASSLGALGAATAHEAAIGAPRCVLVDAMQGRLLVRCVGSGPQAVVIAVLTDAATVLGLVWSRLLQAERQLQAAA